MKIKDLNFKHHRHAPDFFKGISLELEEGRIHALHGKNGVGKSVLLNLLNEQVDDTVLMSQQFDQLLVGPFNFVENMQFAALGKFPSPFSRLQAPLMHESLLEKFHIDLTIPIYKLSGGQRQILALLMKLQKKTRILLLDEPTATLDEQNATMVFDFLKSLEGMTMLIVCHDQELMNRYTTGKKLKLEMEKDGSRVLKEFI
jgi:ABC-type lipoprotein export system ATPase subunit